MQPLTIESLLQEAERLETSGQGDAACNLYKNWIALNGRDPLLHAALFNYSVAMARRGDRAGAINALRESIRVKPDFFPPYINLGRQLEDAGMTGGAITEWLELTKRLGAVNGANVRHKLMALQQLARVLEGVQHDAAAEDAMRQALEINPNQPEVIQHWIASRQKQCKWPVMAEFEGITQRQLMAGISPLSGSVMLDDPVFQLGRAFEYAKQSIGAPVVEETDWKTPQRMQQGRRLRIGYVSSDFREHAVGFGMSEVVELHDRTRFEIFGYYCGIERDDSTKQRIKSHLDHWRDIRGLGDDDSAALIRQDEIDILIDLNGYTRDARTAVFARQPAPIIANWYGFPSTMGTPYHHYIIGDAVVIPPGAEIYYSEKVLRLACYQPNDRKRVVAEQPHGRAAEGLPDNDSFVFCCLNGSQKIMPGMFQLWMHILKQSPNAVLWLLDAGADINQRLRTLAQQCGVSGSRLCFAPKRPNPEHLARYRHADLFLDTFPYGAHTTASDALWMGVPVLTVPGKTFASRVCASLVSSAGCADFICATPEDYAQKAIAIARDPEAQRQRKQEIYARRESTPLFDTPALVSGLEQLFGEMWQDFLNDRLPRPRLTNLDRYADVGVDVNIEGAAVDVANLHAQYAGRFARLNAIYPMEPDGRLWPQPAPEG